MTSGTGFPGSYRSNDPQVSSFITILINNRHQIPLSDLQPSLELGFRQCPIFRVSEH